MSGSVQPSLVLRPSSPSYASIGVQERIDTLVAQFKDSPRGFSKAWCAALDPATVGREAWDGDFNQSLFRLPADVKALASADADLIIAELKASGLPTTHASNKDLAHELEAATTVSGDVRPALASLHRAEVKAHGQDADAYYGKLDSSSASWANLVGKQTYVGSYLLEQMSTLHHARHTALCPIAHDHAAVAAIAGARASSIKSTADSALTKAARYVPASDTSAVVEAFTKGTLRSVRGVNASHLQAYVGALVSKAEAGDIGSVAQFMTHFRGEANHGAGFFANDSVRSDFFRGKFEQPLREAFAAKGLDYTRFNGIFDDAHFAA